MEEKLRIIVSGGGTGGHIFPAVSIANAIKELYPDTEILFIGAEGRMEMQRVPAAGYKIIGLPVAGFDKNHKELQTSCCCRRRRLCQWSYLENGRHDGYSHADTGTKLLCRSHK